MWKIHKYYNTVTKLDNHAKITFSMYRSTATILGSD